MPTPYEATSETSQAAAQSLTRDQLQLMEKLVYDELRKAGSVGCTDDEIELATHLSHQTASARRRALVIKGCARDSGTKRKTRSGRSAVVWVLGREHFTPGSRAAKRAPRPSNEVLQRGMMEIGRLCTIAKESRGANTFDVASHQHFSSEAEMMAIATWLNQISRDG